MSRFRSGHNDLRARSQDYALGIIALVRKLRRSRESIGWELSRQLLRSATSIGANIAEADGAQSRADFIAKCTIALREGYETRYWLELLRKAKLIEAEDYVLQSELTEIIAIINSIISRTRSSPDSLRETASPFLLFAFCFLLS